MWRGDGACAIPCELGASHQLGVHPAFFVSTNHIVRFFELISSISVLLQDREDTAQPQVITGVNSLLLFLGHTGHDMVMGT